MGESEILIFPEVKEILYKEGDVLINASYRIVVGDDASPIEMETALGIAKEVEELSKQRLQVVKSYQASEKESLILVGTSFRDRLTTKLDRSEPEGYVLEVDDGRIILCGNAPSGTFYAGETLKQLLKIVGSKLAVPKLTIKDCPDYTYRGLYVESKWGPDLMTLDDWKDVINFMASLKLNFLDVGVHGCWVIQYENQITEFLLLPLRNYPKLKTPKTIRYYSPDRKRWVSLTYLPRMFTEDFFSEIIAYGKKRNVTVRPAFNSLGHNTLVPREYPEISAIGEDGKPTNYGFCLSNPETLKVMFNIYDEIIERYLKPNGIDFFNIELDEIYPERGKDPSDPKRLVEPWCRCLHCNKKRREDLFLQYVIALIRHLSEKGINKINVWNDQITRMSILNEFASRLKEENLTDKVAVTWWYYGPREKDLETSRFDSGKFGSDLGLVRWIAPMAGYYFWWMYQSLLPNIYLVLKRGFEQGAEGTEAYCTFDYSFHKNYYCLSDYSWNQTKKRDLTQFNEKYAKTVFKDEWRKALNALEQLEKLASAESQINSFLASLFYYRYSYVHPERDYPRPYPQEVIESLRNDPRKPLNEYLREIKELYEVAKSSKEIFLSIKKVRTASPRLVDHYIVECERYQNTLRIFSLIFEAVEDYKKARELYLKDREESSKAIDKVTATVDEALELQETMMLNIEKTKSPYLLPQTLRDLSFMKEFLVALQEEVSKAKEECHGRKVSELPSLSINRRIGAC